MSFRSDLLSSTSATPVRAPSACQNATTTTVNEAEIIDLEAMRAGIRMLEDIREANKQSRVIGTLFGLEIMVDPSRPPGEIVCVNPQTGDEGWRCSVDHQYLKGSKIEKAARSWLASGIETAEPARPEGA